MTNGVANNDDFRLTVRNFQGGQWDGLDIRATVRANIQNNFYLSPNGSFYVRRTLLENGEGAVAQVFYLGEVGERPPAQALPTEQVVNILVNPNDFATEEIRRRFAEDLRNRARSQLPNQIAVVRLDLQLLRAGVTVSEALPPNVSLELVTEFVEFARDPIFANTVGGVGQIQF